MKSAYVLINCDSGSELSVIKELNHLNEIKEVHGVFGPYDIMAKIEAENQDAVSKTITNKVRNLDNIQSAITLVEIENIEQPPEMDEIIPDVIPDEKKPIEPPEEIGGENYEDEEEDDEDFSNKN